MPLCTDWDYFSIRSAPVAQDALNAWYYPSSGNTLGFSIFAASFNRALPGYPRIEVYNLSGSHFAWGVFTAQNVPRYRSSIIYTSLASVITCPNNLVLVHTPGNGGTLPSNITGRLNSTTVKNFALLLGANG